MNSEARLSQIEARLSAIERFIRLTAPKPQVEAAPAPVIPKTQPVPPATFSRPMASRVSKQEEDASPVTNILGWAGATALVMASIYLVVLAVDAG